MILSMLAMAGCQASAGKVADLDTAAARISRQAGGLWVEIVEKGSAAFRYHLSDSDLAMATVEGKSVDFDADGTPEVVVYLWEGQNSGDRAFVLGKQNGRWSCWGSCASATCTYDLSDRNADGLLDITVDQGPDGRNQTTYILRADRTFQKWDNR